MAGFIRSVECRIENLSSHELVLKDAKLEWGSFDVEPAPRVAPQSTAIFRSSTSGFMTGTEGYARFDVPAVGGWFEVRWDNPFIGENEFAQQANGVPNYVQSEPVGVDAEEQGVLESVGLETNDDVIVRFAFRVEETPGGAADGTGQVEGRPSVPPDNEAPKPVVAGEGPVVVQDSGLRFRKVGFIGLNTAQAEMEETRLRQQIPEDADKPQFVRSLSSVVNAHFVAASAMLTVQDQVESFVANLGLAAAGKQLLRGVLDDLRSTGEQRPTVVALARLFIEAELELEVRKQRGLPNSSADGPLRRLILSGHHRGYAKPGAAIVYGHSYSVAMYRHPKNSWYKGNESDFDVLSRHFPRAFGQVEDLCFSACNTGHFRSSTSPLYHRSLTPDFELVPGLLQYFPNLKSVWAQEAVAISGATSRDELSEWELHSRDADCGEKLVELAHERRYRRSYYMGAQKVVGIGHPIVWTRSGDALVPRPPGASA